jgi:NADH-quinone oxidoreductase subunit N
VSSLAQVNAPSVTYGLILPMLIVFGAGVVGVLVEAFLPRAARYAAQVGVALVGLVAAFVAVVLASDDAKGPTLAKAVIVAGPTLFLQGTILVMAVLSVLTMAERFGSREGDAFAPSASSIPGSAYEAATARAGWTQTEVYPLTMLSVGGMMLFPAAGDLLTLFVALEVLSLPLYLLSGMARRRRLLSQEAALKYFLLGAFSSAFLLFGAAMLFGFSGSLYYDDIAKAISTRTDMDPLLLIGVALVAIGLLFKVAAVPFHSWTPDVYQGAPTAVTAFMSACTKVAAFGALLRLFYVAFGPARWDWTVMMGIVAVLTMLVGSILAITQSDMKRLLAYSSIAHVGFVLVGFIGVRSVGSFDDLQLSSVQAVLFYVVTYGFMSIGSFAIVTVVRDSSGEATHLSRWAGLGRESPVLAGVFAFFLLGMAGIPLTSGFTAKWAVFAAAFAGGAWPLVVIGVVLSAVAAFFYLRVIVLMFFSEPVGEGPVVMNPSLLTTVVIAIGFAVTVVLGVFPGPVLDLAASAGQFIR